MIRKECDIPYSRLAGAARMALVAGGVVGITLLAGCSDSGGRFIAADETDMGAGIHGELMSSSEINLKDGTRQGRHWVCGDPGHDGVLYRLDAPFLGRVALYDSRGRWLGAAASTLGSPATVLLGGGRDCYLVVISGHNRKDFGPYTLEPYGPDPVEVLGDGVTVSGRLNDHRQTYGFTLAEASRVELRLYGGDQAGLSLEGVADIQPSACGDDQQILTAYLEPGDYEAVVTPRGRGTLPQAADCDESFVSAGGGYRLSMDRSGLATGQRNAGPLRDADRISGTLAQPGDSNSYTLELAEPTHVTLQVTSAEFDALLDVKGGDVNVHIDDSGDSTDPRFDQLLMPGRYRVQVSGFDGERGGYSVEVAMAPFEGRFRNSGPLTAGETVHGMADGTGPYVYGLTLEQASDVDIGVFSGAFDTLLTLKGPGIELSDDDSGGDTNSRLTTLLMPGDYRVEVSGYGEAAAGPFRLENRVTPHEGEIRQGCQGEDCAIEPGTTVLGVMGEDPQSYRLVLAQSAQVVVSLYSTAFDTLLNLDGEGIELTDDDGGGETNSRISTTLQAGTYRITADSYEGTGSYRLRLDTTPLQ